MLEVFGIGCLVVVLFFFAKEFGKKLPLGCLIIGGIFLFIVIKACNEMKEEEKKKQQFQEEMKKKNEEQTREWQEMHGIYKENVYETK